jgi:hypothetical protein
MEDQRVADFQTLGDDDPGGSAAASRIPFLASFLFGAWYSIVFASSMSLGVKYLHPESPSAHGILQSFAWALGSGFAIALASRLSKTHRLAVGVCSSFISASVWIAFLFLLRADLEKGIVEVAFGHSVSLKAYLIGFSLLTLIVGFVSSFLGATSNSDEELTTTLLMVPRRHWLWLWIAGCLWVSMFPIVAYYIWLQFATALYSIVHPSLWFLEGTDLVLGSLGVAALFIGIEISVKAVSDKESYGGVVWKRVLVFLAGSLVLASVIAPFLLNIDIDRMKEMPASLGSHPWWVL